MPSTFFKTAAIITALMAAPSAQAAGFSAAFGPLKHLTVATTGSIPSQGGVETFCIADRETALSARDVTAFASGEAIEI